MGGICREETLMASFYLDAPRTDGEIAPLAAEDFSNQPQTLILTAEYDPLRDEGEAYGEALKRAGVPVEMHRIPDALHGFFSLPPRFSQVQKAYGYINRFLDEVSHPACQDNP